MKGGRDERRKGWEGRDGGGGEDGKEEGIWEEVIVMTGKQL